MSVVGFLFVVASPVAWLWMGLEFATWGRYGDPPTRAQYARRELAPFASVAALVVAFAMLAVANGPGAPPLWLRIITTVVYLWGSWAAWNDRDDRWQRRRARVAAWLRRRALAPGGAS